MKVHAFPTNIRLNVDAISILKFKLAFYKVTVKHVTHNPTGIQHSLSKAKEHSLPSYLFITG